jgi:hypothetical protein
MLVSVVVRATSCLFTNGNVIFDTSGTSCEGALAFLLKVASTVAAINVKYDPE